MAQINNRMTTYIAPDGYVYDFAIPRANGEHLYVKYLSLTRLDSIDNYILVEDPNGTKDKD